VNSAIDAACAIVPAGTSLPLPLPPPIDAAWFGWLFGVGIASLVLTIVLLPVIMVRLPADHFVRRHRAEPRSAWGWVGFIGKNVLGVVCLAAGVLMLVLPGQGLITLLIGLMLVNFPGKRRLELALVRRPKIRNFLNKMRQKRGKEPFQLDANDAVSASPAASSP
jgi:hypothetical protein